MKECLRSRRRTVIQSLLALAVYPFVSGCDVSGTGKIVEKLVQILRFKDSAAQIGKSYSDDDDIDALLMKISDVLALSESEMKSIAVEKLRSRIGDAVHRDFAEENTVIINGWMFAKTEAMLCRLVYLSSL